jgi:hypothetical protein
MANKITFMHIVCAVALFMSANLFADDNILKPPKLPEPLRDGESIEPEVNIIQKDDRTIEEYRVNGELYMVKVTPVVGHPYYFIDTDGDGSLDSKQFELASGMVPSWIVFKW